MEHKMCPIMRGHIPRKFKKQQELQKVIIFLVLLLAAVFIIIPPVKKILHTKRLSDLEKRCAVVLERKQARISELEAVLEDAE